MPQPKTQADLEAFKRERERAGDLTAMMEENRRVRPPAPSNPRGGLVGAFQTLGIIFLCLGGTGLALGVAAIVAGVVRGGEAVAAIMAAGLTALGSALPVILLGAVLLWMSEVLYRLRRIDERAG
jgi:hypothetical protein